MTYTNPNERQDSLADCDATCPVCAHPGYLHDVDGCHDAQEGTEDDQGIPLRCACSLPRRLIRAAVAIPADPDAVRWTLTGDAWYALEEAETARQDALAEDDGYDWNTPVYDREGTHPWDMNA